jgi:hypothetical protein
MSSVISRVEGGKDAPVYAILAIVSFGENAVQEFISEDDLKTFEGWLKYQGVNAATTATHELNMWRSLFDETREQGLASPKVGLMKLPPLVPGGHRYAVAVREGSDLWLTLWVRHSQKGFFVMLPRADRSWDPHASYHLDGRLHMKSHDHKVSVDQRQPLTGAFRGTEQLVSFMGHGPKSVGAICDTTAFSGVVEVAPGVLGPRNGAVIVDLVEPGCKPTSVPNTIVQEKIFCDTCPHIVIRISS